VVTWEFPVLGKYRLHWARLDASKFEPFVEVGPSFRSTGNLNANPSHYGVAAGVGVDTYWKGFDIAPVLRYTRWAHDPNEYGAAESKSDQLELLVAISWRPHTNSSASGLARSSTGLLPGSRFSMRLITGTNLVGDYPINSGPTTANQLVPVPGGGYTSQQIPATRYQSGWKRTCLLLDRSSRHGGVGFVPASDAGDARRGSALALRMQPGIRSRITLADVAGHGELVSAVAEGLRDVLRKHADGSPTPAIFRPSGITPPNRRGR
jgi:hypothetical protein